MRAMARMGSNFNLSLPVAEASEAVSRAFAAENWKVDSRGEDKFLARENVDLLTRMFRHPSKLIVFLHVQSGTDTRVELHAGTFGFGPLPNSRLRKVLARMQAAIETSA